MFRLNGHSFIILRHARDDHRHLPGTLKSQNVRLLEHESQLLIKVFLIYCGVLNGHRKFGLT